jgi:tRNA/tmRNA/rRNA uracil-C5-methylase (TrmA/RlmC/RlmD family)
MTAKATTSDDARTVSIESLDQEGRGVAHVDGKATFVEGALPGERVAIEILKRKPSYAIARATRVERASASRVAPAADGGAVVRRERACHDGSTASRRLDRPADPERQGGEGSRR